jgi:hypothetical protein
LGSLFPVARRQDRTFLLNTRPTTTNGGHNAAVPTIPLNKAAFAFYRGKKIVAVETSIDSAVITDILLGNDGYRGFSFNEANI